jgi:hypothetical protein
MGDVGENNNVANKRLEIARPREDPYLIQFSLRGKS